jgi:hypothetical protein
MDVLEPEIGEEEKHGRSEEEEVGISDVHPEERSMMVEKEGIGRPGNG